MAQNRLASLSKNQNESPQKKVYYQPQSQQKVRKKEPIIDQSEPLQSQTQLYKRQFEKSQPNSSKQLSPKFTQIIFQVKVKMLTKLFIAKLKNRVTKFSARTYDQNILKKPEQLNQKLSIQGIFVNNYIKSFNTILNIFSIIFVLFVSSFSIFFDEFRIELATHPLLISLNSIFLFFVTIKFFGGFVVQSVSKGKKKTKIGQISLNYIKTFKCYLMFLHLLSLIFFLSHPYQLFTGIFGYCTSFINIFMLDQLQQIIYVTFFQIKLKRQYFQLFKIIFRNFYIVHSFALLMLAIKQYDSSINWMTKYGIANSYWLSQYWYACYWSATIVSTVGFGDITVANDKEAIIAIIIMIIGGINISYNINKVGIIITSLTKSNYQIENKLSTLRKLANSTSMSENLHHQIAQYVEHIIQMKKNYDIKEKKELLQLLPEQMRYQIKEQSSNNYFKFIPFFCQISTQTKIKIAQHLIQQYYAPGQYLTLKVEGLQKIKIVQQGKIGFAYKKKGIDLNGTVLKQITVQNKYPLLLNKYLLIRGKILNYHIVSQSYTVASTMSQQQLQACLRTNKLDYQFYKQIYDSAIISENQWTQSVCEYCSIKHSIFVCSKLHYRPLQTLVVSKYQKTQQKQIRSKFTFKRNKSIKIHTNAWKFRGTQFKKLQKASGLRVPLRLSLSVAKLALSLAQIQQYQQKYFKQLQLRAANLQQHLCFYQASDYDEVHNSFHNKDDVDIIHNFQHYFKKQNPKFIVNKVISINNEQFLHNKFEKDRYISKKQQKDL